MTLAPATPVAANNAATNPSRAVLLVGHGTRDPRGTDEFFELGERLSERTDMPVAPCLLEFQKPTIAQAWQSLVQRGVRHVHVAPLLLFAAGHAKSDIPDEVRAAAAQTPGVTWDQSQPLSRSRTLVDLVIERLAETFRREDLVSERTAVVMVGRGSRDPCARSDMMVLTEVVRHRFAAAAWHTGYYAMTTPTVPDQIDTAAAENVDTVVVHPHLLFSGRLYDAIRRQCDEAARRHPNKRILCSNYLGPVDQVADAVLDRVGRSVPAFRR